MKTPYVLRALSHFDAATSAELRESLGYASNAQYQSLRRLMQHLIVRGLIEKVTDRTYRITEAGRAELKEAFSGTRSAALEAR